MFTANMNKKPLLSHQINKDSYILYKGKMVSSNLIDIEVILTNLPSIRRKIMVDTHDEISQLNSRICEVCELFPKLSGLNRLTPCNFRKKTENGFIDLKSNGLIGDIINAKDTIYFDLMFHEIWLDIEMVLEASNSLLHTITFELKVILNTPKRDFEDTLIKLGIKSWAKIMPSKEDTYFAFNDIEVDYPSHYCHSNSITNGVINRMNSHVSLSVLPIDHQANVFADFDSKVNCKLIFINISNIVYDMVNKPENISSQSFTKIFNSPNQYNEVKRNINKHFRSWIEDKLDHYAIYQRIIWKLELSTTILDTDNDNDNDNENENGNEDENEIDVASLNDNTSYNSFMSNHDHNDFFRFSKKGFTNYKTQKNLMQFVNFTNCNESRSRVNSFLNKTSGKPTSPRKRKDKYYLNDEEYDDLLNKYTRKYISLRAFLKKSTDTKNLVTLNGGILEQFEVLTQIPHCIKNETEGRRNKLKLYLNYIGLIVIIVIIIVVVLLQIF